MHTLNEIDFLEALESLLKQHNLLDDQGLEDVIYLGETFQFNLKIISDNADYRI
jgi:hypothetical protein